MASLANNSKTSFRGWLVIALFLATLLVTWAAVLGERQRSFPHRCPSDFMDLQLRCCAPGQSLASGACVGAPDDCPPPFEHTATGCFLPSKKIALPRGTVTLGPTDWDSSELVERRSFTEGPFEIDRSEVSYRDFSLCVQAGRCQPAPPSLEPGRPVTSVTIEQADHYCRFVGGRLPTPEEWIYAASGANTRRFPWGSHGLVCRRASFGLSEGPCAQGGTKPELPGMRPAGSTPEGLFDMAGNVAEWTKDAQGRSSVHGGSFRKKAASSLKVWSVSLAQAADDIGFRCLYPKH